MRILVTGGAGFIGSHVVDGLVAAGHEVVVVDNLSTGKREHLNPQARFYEVDIRDPDLEEVFRKERFDLVNHHAAQIDVRRSVASPDEDARTNILGLINLLENCCRFGVQGVIFASSGGVVYGEPGNLPVSESFPKQPLSPYGVSKLSSEFYLSYYAQVRGLPYVALRYGNVYGPRQDPYGEAGVVAIFAQKMLQDKQPVIYGDGEQSRDYVYVGDVVQVNIAALELLKNRITAGKPPARSRLNKPCPAGNPTCSINDFAYNIGTGKGTSVNELFHLLKEITGYPGQPVYAPERPGELNRIYLDVGKAKRELGWEPKVALDEGLKLTVQYLRQRGVLGSDH